VEDSKSRIHNSWRVIIVDKTNKTTIRLVADFLTQEKFAGREQGGSK